MADKQEGIQMRALLQCLPIQRLIQNETFSKKKLKMPKVFSNENKVFKIDSCITPLCITLSKRLQMYNLRDLYTNLHSMKALLNTFTTLLKT